MRCVELTHLYAERTSPRVDTGVLVGTRRASTGHMRTQLLVLAVFVLACGGDDDGTTDAMVGDAAGDTSIEAGIDGGLDGASDAVVDAPLSDAGDGCPGLTTRCGAECVLTEVDPANCGMCGNVCGAGEVCFSSGCAGDCPAGLTACDAVCVDTDSDNLNCGTCGTACDAGEGCMGGSCVPAVDIGPPPARCEGGGPPIVIVDEDGTDRCADRTAAGTFTYGLCSCDVIGIPRLSSETLIDAYDSVRGPYMPGGLGGGMGANGPIRTAELDVSGDLRSGNDGVRLGPTDVGQQIHSAGDLEATEQMMVGGDGFVDGSLSGEIEIGGVLHTPSCGGVPGSVSFMSCAEEPVVVPPPCACGAADLINVDAIVAHYSMPANNDNETVGLDSSVFASPGGPRRLDLPCGYYHLDAIIGAVTIVAHGRTALFVSGDIDASASMTFSVDPGATLDVFVTGTLHAEASLQIGSPAYPRNVRFYISGTDDSFDPPRSVDLESDTDLNGLFYAPYGAVVSSSTLEMFGAIFAGSYHNNSSTLIHYDRAASELGDDCPDPPPPCEDCQACGGEACIDGMCGMCRTDGDCCSPLRCIDGECRLDSLL